MEEYKYFSYFTKVVSSFLLEIIFFDNWNLKTLVTLSWQRMNNISFYGTHLH